MFRNLCGCAVFPGVAGDTARLRLRSTRVHFRSGPVIACRISHCCTCSVRIKHALLLRFIALCVVRSAARTTAAAAVQDLVDQGRAQHGPRARRHQIHPRPLKGHLPMPPAHRPRDEARSEIPRRIEPRLRQRRQTADERPHRGPDEGRDYPGGGG